MSKIKRNTKAPVKSFCGPITVGIDTHLKDYHVCLYSTQDECIVDSWVQPSDANLLITKLTPWRPQITQIVYEAGPVGFCLARTLLAGNWPAIITSPGDIPMSRFEAKCDRRDAHRLALMSSRKLLSPIYIPTAEHDAQRQIQRQRNQLLKDRKRCQVRIRMFMLYSGAAIAPHFRWQPALLMQMPQMLTCPDQRATLQLYIQAYQSAQQLVGYADNRLSELAKRPHIQPQVNHLSTIPGIAQRTALEFILEMGPPDRFETKHQVAKYQGLAPEVRSSGQSRKEGPLNRSGNRRLKTLLIEAAWRWRRYCPHAKAYYNKMFANTGNAQKAITALAHKLGIIMWRILSTATSYDPAKIRDRHKQTNQPLCAIAAMSTSYCATASPLASSAKSYHPKPLPSPPT